MSLVSLLYAIDVQPSEEWQEVFDNYAPLIRLSRVEKGRSPQTTPRNGGGGGGAGLSSGEDEERVSPASSPTGAHPEMLKYLRLTAPVAVELPPPLPTEELAFYHVYASKFAAEQEAEKEYIAFIFQEYCKRKSVEQKEQTEVDELVAALADARSRELPPHVRNLLDMLTENENKARDGVLQAYEEFLQWVEATTPIWLEAVHKQEERNREQAEAKRAALAAAKAALAEELANGKELGPGPAVPVVDALDHPRPRSLSPPLAVAADGTLNYTPSVNLGDSGAASGDTDAHHPGASPSPPAAQLLTESELRQKAIKMLEHEEEEMKKRRDEQLQRLKAQEEAIRTNLEAKERQRAAEEARQHDDALARRYQSLLEQESAIQGRIHEREEQRRQQDEERRMKLEHIAAEEELLRRRLKEQEDRRKAAQEEKEREEQRNREELYEHVRAEEELLRQRLQQREAERQAEAQRQAALAEEARRRELDRLAREQAALEERHRQRQVQQAQDEALRRAQEEHARREKERQLRLLAEQEESVKARLRAQEMAAIQQREALRQREIDQLRLRTAAAVPASSHYTLAPPPAAAGYYDPYRAPPAVTPSYPPYPAYPPPPQHPHYPQQLPQPPQLTPYGGYAPPPPAAAGGYYYNNQGQPPW